MLYDYIENCKCAIDEETADRREMLEDLKAMRSCAVGLMPAIQNDLYPVFALSCTGAKRIVSPGVYIIPVGVHDLWAKHHFEEVVDRFYRDDEYREQFDIGLEEMLLLIDPGQDISFTLYDGTGYNTVICRVTLPDGTERFLVIVPLTPEDCWKKIIEPYGVKCDILIDSHKGLGGWFDSVPLYRVMRETEATGLLPRYYFKGMYISHEAPPGFKLLYVIPEIIYYQGRTVDDRQKEIYEIDWNENKSTPEGPVS